MMFVGTTVYLRSQAETDVLDSTASVAVVAEVHLPSESLGSEGEP